MLLSPLTGRSRANVPAKCSSGLDPPHNMLDGKVARVSSDQTWLFRLAVRRHGVRRAIAITQSVEASRRHLVNDEFISTGDRQNAADAAAVRARRL